MREAMCELSSIYVVNVDETIFTVPGVSFVGAELNGIISVELCACELYA